MNRPTSTKTPRRSLLKLSDDCWSGWLKVKLWRIADSAHPSHSIACALGLAVAGLTGCSTAGGMASDIGLAGAGGALAYELSDGDIGVTAAGATGGYLVSKLAQSQVKKAINEAEQRGYDRAMNQAVKQQYWIIQNQQRSFETNQADTARFVPVQLPETTVNGVILNPSVEYLRVE